VGSVTIFLAFKCLGSLGSVSPDSLLFPCWFLASGLVRLSSLGSVLEERCSLVLVYSMIYGFDLLNLPEMDQQIPISATLAPLVGDCPYGPGSAVAYSILAVSGPRGHCLDCFLFQESYSKLGSISDSYTTAVFPRSLPYSYWI